MRPMRRTLTLALVLTALAVFSLTLSLPGALAQSADRLRVAPGPVTVRENPSNGSPKVMSLKSGQRVRIDYEADGWVAVFPPDQKNRAESSALGYVRLSDLRLAGPLDLKRDPSGKDEPKAAEKAKDKEKDADKDKKKSDKAKTAAERRKEAKAAKAEAERERKEAAKEAKAAKNVKEGKALKVAGGKGAVSRDEMPATPQQKATVRTASVVVEKPVDPEQRAAAKAALAEAKSEARPEAKPEARPEAKAEAKPAPKAKPASPPPPPPVPKEEDFGVIRMPDRPLAVRSARTKDSEFKKLLQPGQKVRTDFHSDGFFAVFAPEERVRDIKRAWGYGRDKYLFTEKELAERGFHTPPSPAKPEAKPEDKPEPKPETKPEPKPEPKPEIKPVGHSAPVEPRKPAPQPEHKNATAPAPVAAQPAPAQPMPVPSVQEKKPAPAQAEPAPAPVGGDEVLGYSLLERREDPLRPLAPVMLRVRLETAQAPSQETLRRVVREIWKGERRKADEVVMEVYLQGMDSTSLAYAVARFGPDGKIRELYWRDSLVPRKR